MNIRIIFLILGVILLSGCPPIGAIYKQRDLQVLDVGLGVDGIAKILKSNEKVDELAGEVITLMEEHGFEINYSTTSWGLQPLTGHTQNLSFGLHGTKAIYCYVQISKKEFQARFSEVETMPQSGKYSTTVENRSAIDKAIASLNELAKTNIQGRSVRISRFDRASP